MNWTEAETDHNETMEWVIEQENSGERIDKFVTESLDEETSRSQIQLLVKSGQIKVNGAAVKSNHKLSVGDTVVLSIPDPVAKDIVAEAIPLEVVYEDSDLIVVNKERGMVVHPAPGHTSGTLVNAFMHHCTDLSGINGELRPGIVHRIDKDTSGLLMAAKNDKAHVSLAQQLKDHSVTRVYTAVVHGNVAHDHGTIDAPLGRDAVDRKMFAVTNRNSKHAVTHFLVLERIGNFTVLQLKLETGRTHQIRAHLKFIGHPIIGDPVYGLHTRFDRWMEGQALHAGTLGFRHPRTDEYLEFEAPLPNDMVKLLEVLRT